MENKIKNKNFNSTAVKPYVVYNSTAVEPYQLQTITKDGKQYLVVPVVMMVEGVHSGSAGPIYHSSEVLAQAVSLWEGKPVTISHPRDAEGNFISVNQTNMDETVVGVVTEPSMDGTKLRANVLLDVQKLTAISIETLQKIINKEPMDVSVGIFSETDNTSGQWNGESYAARAINHIPDHLALLPNEEGACNWNDGCGLRVNNKKPINLYVSKKSIKQFYSNGLKLNLVDNVNGMMELISAAWDALDRMDKDGVYYYLEEIYDDYLIYVRSNSEDGSRKLFKVGYKRQEDGTISFVGDSIPVVREVTYRELNTMSNSKKMNAMNKQIESLVDELIMNNQSKFTNCDREWLSSLSVNQLKDLMPKEDAEPNPEPLTVDAALAFLKTQELKEEHVLQLMSEQDRTAYQFGKKLYAKQRAEYEKTIIDNSSAFKEEDVKSMDFELLQKIAESISPKKNSGAEGDLADFSAMSAGGEIINNEANDDDILPFKSI